MLQDNHFICRVVFVFVKRVTHGHLHHLSVFKQIYVANINFTILLMFLHIDALFHIRVHNLALSFAEVFVVFVLWLNLPGF